MAGVDLKVWPFSTCKENHSLIVIMVCSQLLFTCGLIMYVKDVGDFSQIVLLEKNTRNIQLWFPFINLISLASIALRWFFALDIWQQYSKSVQFSELRTSILLLVLLYLYMSEIVLSKTVCKLSSEFSIRVHQCKKVTLSHYSVL